jgi:hypothetical protein
VQFLNWQADGAGTAVIAIMFRLIAAGAERLVADSSTMTPISRFQPAWRMARVSSSQVRARKAL